MDYFGLPAYLNTILAESAYLLRAARSYTPKFDDKIEEVFILDPVLRLEENC